ncbi:hypothetical protein GCU60_11225 [Blastococcus saxobsidens]|uniref:Uncharacterized protein n=1 Tax=Blastococcus saxobsidens TaxID=138336 RepID=A0A6L9W2K8_9ACTN|nr:hypothetical protein [Blastococcus saxobsidens]NEK86326.1 hypothetical protein [Blastococcus saxobsidens]
MNDPGAFASPELIGDDATAEIRDQARHELRHLALTAPPLVVGVALLRLEPAQWSAGGWGTAGAFSAMLALVAWALLGTERGRRPQSRRLLAEYAVRRHADPGPGRRQAADRRAADMARMRILGPLFLLVLLAPHLALAAWEDLATTIPGAACALVAALLLLAESCREARAGRHWLADPPGPPRD